MVFKLTLKSVFVIILQLIIVSLHGQLTIHVTSIPANTPEGDIYIAGNFNNWNPGNPAYKLTDVGNNMFSITFSPPIGSIEFKFTMGDWNTVEGNAAGNYIPNRTYNYSGNPETVNITIAGWEGLSGNTHTASKNVSILDEDFYIPQLNRSRRIWLYLPPDYHTTSKRYPVIYMQDGQNLFDAYYSFAGEWKVDESMNALFDNGDDGAIVIGIDNGGSQRINEYSAWYNPGYGGGSGELFAEFIVHTLKPYIDSNYRTLPQREYTAIAGSSLGANISMYTAIEFQETFSKVGILSPSFWFSDSIYHHVAEEGIHEEMKIYFVAGDQESQTMLPKMQEMYNLLLAEGMDENQLSFIHHPDGAHSEWYWAREYPSAYEWLFDEVILSQKPLRVAKNFITPNPAEKFLRIEYEAHNIPYTIYSYVGTLVRHARTLHDSIDISGLAPGLYYLEIKGNNNEYLISRFIKK